MRICLIGNSGHSVQTKREMELCPDAEFVGIAPSCNLESTRGMELLCGVIFEDYKKMLDETKPDIAIVNPVFGYTGAIIKECAIRGINVFAEKPIATTLDELASVKQCIKDNNIHFSAMHFPIPRAPPVTTATLFLKSNVKLLLIMHSPIVFF